jgi:hypothetical protein
MMALSASWTAFLDLAADCELIAAAEEPEPMDTKLSPVDDWGRLMGT